MYLIRVSFNKVVFLYICRMCWSSTFAPSGHSRHCSYFFPRSHQYKTVMGFIPGPVQQIQAGSTIPEHQLETPNILNLSLLTQSFCFRLCPRKKDIMQVAPRNVFIPKLCVKWITNLESIIFYGMLNMEQSARKINKCLNTRRPIWICLIFSKFATM